MGGKAGTPRDAGQPRYDPDLGSHLLIMGAVTFTVIMPIGGWLFTGCRGYLHLNGNNSRVLAGLFLLAVMFGVHQGFVPVYFALVDAQGFNSLFPILAMAGAGQVGAALALYWRARSTARCCGPRLKGRSFPAFSVSANR